MSTGDILSDIHDMPPVDTRYVAGRWHHDRVALGGFAVEARVFIKSLLVPRNANQRFLIVGRARSGTTLLTRLLNAQSRIRCDGEVLKRNVLAPRMFFDRLAGKSPAAVFGAKVLSYQMVQVHRMRAPQRFLGSLAARGVKLIHLERDTFFQTLSLAVAQARQQYHSDKGAGALRTRVRLEPEDFLARLRWSAALLDYERAALAALPHLHISYERDLASPEAQMATLGRVCALFGLDAEPVAAPLKKVLPTAPDRIIENYDEIRQFLEARGCAYFLPDDLAQGEDHG